MIICKTDVNYLTVIRPNLQNMLAINCYFCNYKISNTVCQSEKTLSLFVHYFFILSQNELKLYLQAHGNG